MNKAECEAFIEKAHDLEMSGLFEDAKNIYQSILKENNDELQSGLVILEFAKFWFRSQQYEQALDWLVKAYEVGICRDEAWGLISEAYYVPNESAFRAKYYQNWGILSKRVEGLETVPFDLLKYKFIPCSDTKYYVFSLDECMFIDKIDIQETKTTKQVTDGFFIDLYSEKLIEVEEGKVEKIILAYSNRDYFMAAVQLFSIYFLNNKKIEFVLTLSDFIRQWEKRANGCGIKDEFKRGAFESYLHFYDKVYCQQNGEKIGKTKRLSEFKKLVVDDVPEAWEQGDTNIILSICIPTYNRGPKALATVKHILQFDSEEIEVVVCDNHSPDPTGEYQTLAQTLDTRLNYYRNDTNVGFAGNFYKVIEKAKGKYVFILSDEDFVNLAELSFLIKFLYREKNCSVVCGSLKPGKENTNAWPRQYRKYKAGIDALINAAFQFSYISAIVFNRGMIIDKELYVPLYQKLNLHNVYPHFYLVALLAVYGDVITLAEHVAIEGEAEVGAASAVNDSENAIYSYEGRLNQHSELALITREVCKYIDEQIDFYLKLCEKTITLIMLVNGPIYQGQGRNLSILGQNAFYHFLSTASAMFLNINARLTIEKKLLILFRNWYGADFHTTKAKL